MTNPVFNQNGFRFYDDDGSHTALQNENIDHEIAADVNFTLRFEVEVTNAKSALNSQFTLYAEKNATGGFNQVTTTSTNGIQIELSGNFADEDADNNNRLTSSSLTFTGGSLHEADLMGTTQIDFAGEDHWELEICLAIDSANSGAGDTFDFEIRDSGGTQLNSYTRRPRVTRAALVALNELTLAGAAPSVSPVTDQTVTMGEATLAGAAQSIAVVLPRDVGHISIMSPAGYSMNKRPAFVAKGAAAPQTVVVNQLTLAGSAETITVVPGAVSITMNELTLAGSAETITVVPGAVSTTMNELTLVGSAETITVLAPVDDRVPQWLIFVQPNGSQRLAALHRS